MPVPSHPALTPFIEPGPNRGQDEEDFDTNQQNFVNSQFNNVTEQNVLAVWAKNTADFTELKANAAEVSAGNAADSESSAEENANRAEEAAATAQEAAGLPPLDTFGRVLHTEGQDNTKTSAFTAVSSRWYEIDSTAGGFPITAPLAPAIGDWFAITYTHAVTLSMRCHIDRNGELIMAIDDDLQLTKGFKTYLFRFTPDGWRFS